MYSFLINKNFVNVYINIEKVNKYLIHSGITFEDINNNERIRYDFRAFNDNYEYITTDESRKNVTLMFPNLDNNFLDLKGLNNLNNENTDEKNEMFLISKEIFWGTTNYSLQDIKDFEQTLHKKYIIGLYDCRHYVNEFSLWALNKSSPIWDLHKFL
tara:strand:- start:1977 stop:2447 length:471 start_codon:yes stop_codon:yes gene_type:complete